MSRDSVADLDFLSRTAADLEMPDPLRERCTAALARGEDLRDAAQRWRRAAEDVEDAAAHAENRLGGIDGSWQGADADAFLTHMREVGRDHKALVDSMRALADALDHTADVVEGLLRDMREVIADGADTVSEALLCEQDQRAREHLKALARPVRELADSVEDALAAFAQFCGDFDRDGARRAPEAATRSVGSTAGTPSGSAGTSTGSAAGTTADPAAGTTPSDAAAGTMPSGSGVGGGDHEPQPGGSTGAVEPTAVAPPVSGATAASGAAVGGGMGVGMMPMGMMGGMARSGGQDRQNSSRIKASSAELFGEMDKGAPAVLGEITPEEKQEEEKQD